ncbi:MAG: hypothetical protein ACK4MS_10465 [Paracoccaceae bacterium]
MIRLLMQILGGGLPDQLRRAYEAKVNAQNDEARIAAEVQIARLQNRLAQPGNRLLQASIGLAALGVCGHLFAVAFVSAFPFWGWTVHALPAPMNEWQREIILGLFGLGGLALALRR